MTNSDLLRGAVSDYWETAAEIAERAGVDTDTARALLPSLVDDRCVQTMWPHDDWPLYRRGLGPLLVVAARNKSRVLSERVLLYRRGPRAPSLATVPDAETVLRELRVKLAKMERDDPSCERTYRREMGWWLDERGVPS